MAHVPIPRSSSGIDNSADQIHIQIFGRSGENEILKIICRETTEEEKCHISLVDGERDVLVHTQQEKLSI
jgi:hypothetical protein